MKCVIHNCLSNVHQMFMPSQVKMSPVITDCEMVMNLLVPLLPSCGVKQSYSRKGTNL